MSNDTLGDRMKNFESVSQSKLMRRTPTIIRIDGKAFHTWTRQLKDFDKSLEVSPFSVEMNNYMTETCEYLLNNIQNAVFVYTQSDEISILLNDWKTLETSQWFDAKVQKIASVAASMATAKFNFMTTADWYGVTLAMFDARVFNLPMNEVTNYFIWRQQDASRNSVQMLARFYFSHKELHGKNNSEIQDMLMLQKGVNWNDIKTWMKRGTCVYKKDGNVVHDKEIPIFTQDRNFVERFLGE